jgi:hypothetical protein
VRTTVTLDDDTEQLIRRRMRERKVSFKQALNDAVREGCAGRTERPPFRTETAPLGRASVDLDRALQVAGALEDEELVARMRRQ